MTQFAHAPEFGASPLSKRISSINAAQNWVSLLQAAERYSVSVDTLRRRIASGDLPASRAGKRLIRVNLADVDALFRPIPTVNRGA